MPLPRLMLFGPLAALAACAPAVPVPAPLPEPPARAPAIDPYRVPELPPGSAITAGEYAARRAALLAGLEDGVLLVLGAAAPPADYLPFAQDPDFRYLTGITEPEAALVVSKSGGAVTERIFVQARDPARELWEGARLGARGAEALTGMSGREIDRLPATLDSLLGPGVRLYTTAPATPGEPGLLQALSPQQQLVRRLGERHPGLAVVPLGTEVERLRATKSQTELDLIRRAVYITGLAHRAAMRAVSPGMNEFEIQALIEYTFRRYGAEGPAFLSIVGSGPNATTLHYHANDRFMGEGDVLLMDIGASYRGYAADVTRTVPVDGTFSPEQREIYAIVLEAQKAAEELARPGATWEALNAAARGRLAEGLARLGLIDSPTAVYDCAPAGSTCPQLRLFFMHGLGHGIGLEVHDPDASYFGPFQVGSVFTIEPGIYVRRDALDHLPDTPGNRALIERLRPVLERYVDIGVRLEDDYIVTAAGVERISAGAPREIEEVEALMALPADAGTDRRSEIVEWYRETERR